MKLDRRKFLSCLGAAIGGGAVGTLLTPLPWKVMDDVAIWTQNWPGIPVPEDGRYSYVPSICTLCPGGCGISVRKVNTRAVKIEGLQEHPINKGGICLLGLSGLQYLYGPSRVKSPLKRNGKRGGGKWKPVSWDNALADITKYLSDLRSQGKPHTLAWISESGKGTFPAMIDRFLSVYGSPNHLRASTTQDALEQAVDLTQGNQGTAVSDIENADFILSFGTGILDGWNSPVQMFNLYGNSFGQKTIIQIEPRLSDTAAKSSQWIGIIPGTEGALALGIANVMILESLYDQNFIENFAFGFEDRIDDAGEIVKGFKSVIMDQFPPEKVSKITGIPAQKIREIARRFAKADKPLALYGRGQGWVPGSISETLAVYCLNALVGNINRPGGVWVFADPDITIWPEINYDEIASNGLQQNRVDGAASEKFPNTGNLLHRLPEVINAANGESPVQALLISDANPLYSLPDVKTTKKAFDKIPFIVSFSPYLDETAAYADYILPDHTYLERYQDSINFDGISATVTGLSKPALRPLYDTRHTGDVIIGLAKSLGEFISNAFPWEDYESFLKEIYADNWDDLKENGFVQTDREIPETTTYKFNTSSGKFEFYPPDTSPGKAASALPGFTPVPIKGNNRQFPLTLIPYDSIRIANHYIGNAPFMTKTVDDTVIKKDFGFIEINPDTAKTLRMSEGETVKLATPMGQATVKVHLYEGIAPGVIAMPRGLGHTAYRAQWALEGKGINTNELIGPIDDPASGLNTAWGIRAKLTKV